MNGLKVKATLEEYTQSQLSSDRFQIKYKRGQAAKDEGRAPMGGIVYSLFDTKTNKEYPLENAYDAESGMAAAKTIITEMMSREYIFGDIFKAMSREKTWGNSEMQTLLAGEAITASQPRPSDQPPTGMEWAYDPQQDSWFLLKKASDMLAGTSYLDNFMHKAFPNPPKEIIVGSTVYIKGLKRTAKVIRVTRDNVYRTEIDGNVMSCWLQELLPLA